MGREQEMIEGARSGNYSLVERILNQRAKRSGPLASLRRGPGANAQDVSGYTSLHHAALNGHKDIVSLLLQHEASTNVMDNKGSTPLHLAAWTGNTEIVQLLLEQGPSVPNVNLTNHDRETALHSAAQYGHTDVVALLLKHESDSSIRNLRHESPMDLAAQYGRLETVELLAKTHPLQLRDLINKHSPLHLACRNGHKQVVKTLIEYGFEVHFVTENGSALHEAALYGKIEVARLLLEHGIDVNLEDSQKRTVFDLLKDVNTNIAKQISRIVEEYTTVVSRPEEQYTTPSPSDHRFSRSPGGSDVGRFSRQLSPHAGSDKAVSPQYSTLNGSRSGELIKTPNASKPQPPVKPPRRSVVPVSPGSSNHSEPGSGSPKRLSDPLASLDIKQPVIIHENGSDIVVRPEIRVRVTNGNSSPFSALYDDIASGRISTLGGPQRRVVRTGPPGERPPKPPKPNTLDLRTKRATVQIPLSPTNYKQPPTPEFSPPSPTTAIIGIHEKIRPLSLTEECEKNLWKQLIQLEYHGKRLSKNIHTLTDENLFATIDGTGNVKISLRKQNKSVSTDTLDEVIEDDPFAGLCRGSVIHISNGNNNNKSYTMDSNDNKNNSSTLLSPFDENSEWAEIADIMASFGSGLARESVFVREMEEHFTRALASNKKSTLIRLFPEEVPYTTVAEWLSSLGLCQYMTDFISNGFDDIHFLGSNILDEKDLREIGISDHQHRKRILDSTNEFPIMKSIGVGEDRCGMPDSVENWLELLHLTQYQDTFRHNGFSDMSRVLRLWDLELNTILEVNLLGHRKRILASVGEGHSEFDGLDDLDLSKLDWNLSDLSIRTDSIPPRNDNKPEDIDTLPIRPPPQLMGEPGSMTLKSPQQMFQETPAIMTAEWRHQTDTLVKGSCNYKSQYLGSTLVKELKGVESTRKSILKMKSSTRDIGKIPYVILAISSSGVKFIDGQTNNMVCEHEVRNIHCACQDADDLNHFAYITKEHQTENHYCHVFCAQSRELSTEIILTLGQAFEVAYQLAIRDKPIKKPYDNKSDDQKIADKKKFVSHVTVQMVQKGAAEGVVSS